MSGSVDEMDFAPWDYMLQTYVANGEVDYARWQTEASGELDRWLEGLQATELEKLNWEGAIALLINLYNALVIQQVLQRYPIDSIRPQILGMPNWLSFWRFFTRTVYHLNGQSLSLNQIEHGILRDRYSTRTREPRIHFALVCAARGCPLLRAEAYWPDRLSAQLTEDAHRFINNPDKVRYDAAQNRLYCSKIFQWYKQDFLARADSLQDYIRPRLEIPLPAEVRVVHRPYSWDLNQRTSS